MQEFYSRPDFVVNEVIDLPSSDEEDEGDLEQNRVDFQMRSHVGKSSSLDEDDFEAQNEEERRWQREEAARRAAAAAERGGRQQGQSESESESRSEEEQQWRCFQQKVIESTTTK